MRVSLTDRFVSGAKALGAPQVDYFDSNTAGLALRVSSTGRKAWTFLYTSPRDGRRSRTTLGTYPATSLAVARRKALEARAHVEEGRDPRDVVTTQEAGAMTVQGLIHSYLENHVRPNLRSAAAIERRLKKNVLPIIGTVRLADLHRRDVNRVVDPVAKRGSPAEAACVFKDIRSLLRWGMWRGDIDANPIDGMKTPQASAPRERVLSDDEIKALWNALPTAMARSKACQLIIKLCLVTAQRVGEVAGMRLAEIDRSPRVWTIPGARTKNGQLHTVPLSDLALEIIDAAIAEAGKGAQYVFPEENGSLPPLAVAQTIWREQLGLAHWTAHDLRRTAVTGMARLGVQPIVLGHVVNHRGVTKAGVTLSVYSHYDYAGEKRQALDVWAERLQAIITGGAEVVPLHGIRR